jgi:hypothetical protein
MLKEALRLHRLFERGFLADSPDFVQEKQVDGRYILTPRLTPQPIISPHIPTNLITSVTLEGYAGPTGSPDYHFGPFTWHRLLDGLPITAIVQFNRNPVTPLQFQSGVDYQLGGFYVYPFGFGIWGAASFGDPDANKITMNIQDGETAAACNLIMARHAFGVSIDRDLSDHGIGYSDLDETLSVGGGIDFRYVAHIEWDR